MVMDGQLLNKRVFDLVAVGAKGVDEHAFVAIAGGDAVNDGHIVGVGRTLEPVELINVDILCCVAIRDGVVGGIQATLTVDPKILVISTLA